MCIRDRFCTQGDTSISSSLLSCFPEAAGCGTCCRTIGSGGGMMHHAIEVTHTNIDFHEKSSTCDGSSSPALAPKYR